MVSERMPVVGTATLVCFRANANLSLQSDSCGCLPHYTKQVYIFQWE